MAVRVLLVFALLAALYGCGQASAPSNHPEKKGTDKAAGQLAKESTVASPNHDGAARGIVRSRIGIYRRRTYGG
jgi:hypothetical protein